MEHVYELINDECTLTPPSVTDKKAGYTSEHRIPTTLWISIFLSSRPHVLSFMFLSKPLLTKARSVHLPTVWRPQYSTLRTS
jgi:hypothetical protein